MGQPNTPESNISEFGRAFKEQARPVFMGVFAHRSDVPFINLSTLYFERQIKCENIQLMTHCDNNLRKHFIEK